MRIEAALRGKHHRIVTVRMTDTVATAARRLRSENVGFLVVKDTCATEGDAILGLLTERDILQIMIDHGERALKHPVARLMRPAAVCCELHDDVDRALNLMRQHRIGHVPVLHDGSLVGVVSMGDIVSASMDAGGRELVAA